MKRVITGISVATVGVVIMALLVPSIATSATTAQISAISNPVALKPIVRKALRHDTSPPVRSMPTGRHQGGVGAGGRVRLQQTGDASPIASFDGIWNMDEIAPSDSNGDVGMNQ
ncbi:MAG TPA: hypothetical protein VFK89_00005, partial [Actinomycetota bacterium]|nr:hypothetical protein [Actinomycetota bacterium]